MASAVATSGSEGKKSNEGRKSVIESIGIGRARVRPPWRGSRWRWRVIVIALLLASPLAAVAETPAPESGATPERGVVADAAAGNPDPWETMNRAIFDFNEVTDVYVLAPVARGWGYVTPHFFHVAIRNFNGLILMPTVFFNDILQLKGEHAMEDIGRMLFNVSFGLLGLIDVATAMGIPQNDADFGQTLGYWGAPTGPYLVLPLFGPSSIRGGIGRIGDGAGTFYFTWLPIWATFLVRGVDIISWRSEHLEEVDLSRRESLDYYVFMRDAYMQLRRAKIQEARGVTVATPSEEEDLYFYDGLEDDDEPDE